MDDCTIRPMEEKDLSAVASLYSQMYQEQKSYGMLMELQKQELHELLKTQLKSKLHILLVLEIQDRIEGFASAGIVRLPKKYSLREENFIGFIHDLYVCPALRGFGCAKRLLEELEKRLTAAQVTYVELHVLQENLPGHQFWSRRGYKDIIQVMYKVL